MTQTPPPVDPRHFTSTGITGERQRRVLAIIAEVKNENKKLD